MVSVPEDLIRETINEVVERFLKPKFIELGMNASGRWLTSVSVESMPNVGEIKGKDYTKFLSDGRGPNKDQSDEALHKWAKWAAATVIKDWARQKGIDPRYTFPIAYSIAKNGTKYYPNGTDLLNILNSTEVTTFIDDKIGTYLIEETQKQMLDDITKIFR